MSGLLKICADNSRAEKLKDEDIFVANYEVSPDLTVKVMCHEEC